MDLKNVTVEFVVSLPYVTVVNLQHDRDNMNAIDRQNLDDEHLAKYNDWQREMEYLFVIEETAKAMVILNEAETDGMEIPCSIQEYVDLSLYTDHGIIRDQDALNRASQKVYGTDPNTAVAQHHEMIDRFAATYNRGCPGEARQKWIEKRRQQIKRLN